MSASDAVRQRIALVSGAGGAKRHLMHPFNGRFHPIDHGALDVLIDAMVARIDVTAVDYVLGFPEGGSVPAYAFGRAVGRPVILASRLPLDRPDRVSFEQPQANLGTTQYVYGLKPGDRVMIFEDVRTRLRHHPAMRRFAFGAFERLRLYIRSRGAGAPLPRLLQSSGR